MIRIVRREGRPTTRHGQSWKEAEIEDPSIDLSGHLSTVSITEAVSGRAASLSSRRLPGVHFGQEGVIQVASDYLLEKVGWNGRVKGIGDGVSFPE